VFRKLLWVGMGALLFNTSIVGQGRPQETRQDTLKELQRRLEILTEEFERLRLGEIAEPRPEGAYGLGPAAAKVYQVKKGVSLAGYGEVVYDKFSDEKDDGTPSGKQDQLDYLRNVVYVAFKYSDRLLFNSEIEFEHASTGDGVGEVSMEFGYVDLKVTRGLSVRAGMVLIPVGHINERHEPPTFHGTSRPDVERFLLPTTWRANGIGVSGEVRPGLRYRVYLTEGLRTANYSASMGIRGGRQSGAKSVAEKLAWSGRLDYEVVTGVLLGASFYTGNDATGEVNVRTTVWDLHAEYGWRGLELRSLYARISLDGAERLGTPVGKAMTGWYGSVAYDLLPWIFKGTPQYLAPFIQYERYNTQTEMPKGFVADPANDRTVRRVGLTYKPHPNVALKIDFQNRENEANTGIDQFGLAVSYLF